MKNLFHQQTHVSFPPDTCKCTVHRRRPFRGVSKVIYNSLSVLLIVIMMHERIGAGVDDGVVDGYCD